MWPSTTVSLTAFGGLWSGGRVNVGFLRKVAMGWDGSSTTILAAYHRGGLVLACARSSARKICPITSWDGSVVDNARVEGLVRPLPDDFQMSEASGGWDPSTANGGMRAAFAAAYARDYDYYLSLNNV
jgi:hypothetical protein